ncbi:hypothetical protein NKR23_g3562 [Pleurostoma richardsiae]|uniref:RNase MRP protein 1 RNA binding domain-containing protein n=1 Tax=Pleurostoma richardsiae TaxID=41990 RepID=A0AA38RJB8_9PEZI|nr:hypothetical protein NKR23_g3562 [Pleurostoma richardsiae]
MLDAFNHRNKNQHHSSRWWTPFDILRRCVRRLVVDLEQAMRVCGRTGGQIRLDRANCSKQSWDRTVSAVTRARWLLDHAVPRAYIAFTQLAADNQYASLALLLLGILTEVFSTAALLARVDAPMNDPLHTDRVTQFGCMGAETTLGSDDIGVAVSRGSPLTADFSYIISDKQSRASLARDSLVGDDPRKTETAACLNGARVMASTATKRKERRKRKSGDEFDNMFNSLI